MDDRIPPWTDCEWRPAPGLEGWAVSEDGRAAYRCKRTGEWKPSEAKPRDGGEGYTVVGPMGEQDYLHRLVCAAWHGRPPFPRAQARHLDDKKPKRNVPANLQWGDGFDNAEDRRRNGLYESLEGEAHFNSDVKDRVVAKVFLMHRFGARPKVIAHRLELSVGFVYDVLSGRRRLASTRRWFAARPEAFTLLN